jgi:hypothetical protein
VPPARSARHGAWAVMIGPDVGEGFRAMRCFYHAGDGQWRRKQHWDTVAWPSATPRWLISECRLYFEIMHKAMGVLRTRRRQLAAVSAVSLLVLLFARHFYLYGQDKSQFPDGYDAVQAAPTTHKVIFENELVRILEASVPPAGQKIPMHHHRWPSFFLDWDTGGGSPHIRYHRGDGSVRDIPSKEEPRHPGVWRVGWMKPEAMHSIEVVSKPLSAVPRPEDPPELRIEIKCHP